MLRLILVTHCLGTLHSETSSRALVSLGTPSEMAKLRSVVHSECSMFFPCSMKCGSCRSTRLRLRSKGMQHRYHRDRFRPGHFPFSGHLAPCVTPTFKVIRIVTT